jgi:hypothetical protein
MLNQQDLGFVVLANTQMGNVLLIDADLLHGKW